MRVIVKAGATEMTEGKGEEDSLTALGLLYAVGKIGFVAVPSLGVMAPLIK